MQDELTRKFTGRRLEDVRHGNRLLVVADIPEEYPEPLGQSCRFAESGRASRSPVIQERAAVGTDGMGRSNVAIWGLMFGKKRCHRKKGRSDGAGLLKFRGVRNEVVGLRWPPGQLGVSGGGPIWGERPKPTVFSGNLRGIWGPHELCGLYITGILILLKQGHAETHREEYTGDHHSQVGRLFNRGAFLRVCFFFFSYLKTYNNKRGGAWEVKKIIELRRGDGADNSCGEVYFENQKTMSGELVDKKATQ